MTKFENPKDNEKTLRTSTKVHIYHILRNNNLTVIRGVVGGGKGGKGQGFLGATIKDSDKTEEGMEAREGGVDGWSAGVGGCKCRQP